MVRDILGSFEYQILSVLLQQPRDAYGVTIADRIEKRAGREVSIGALYTALDRLERKGFVESWWGEPTAERGGRRKRHYQIRAPGVEALQRMDAMLTHFAGAGAPTPQGA